ncbi:hypothetical protein [Sphingomonas sp. HMP9]
MSFMRCAIKFGKQCTALTVIMAVMAAEAGAAEAVGADAVGGCSTAAS